MVFDAHSHYFYTKPLNIFMSPLNLISLRPIRKDDDMKFKLTC